MHKLLFSNTSGIEGHNTSFTFIQTEHLSSLTQESNTLLMQKWAILLSRILYSKLNISTMTALSPQDHWSIPLLNMVPYWHWQLAGLHSRLSICLINSIYFKHTKWSIGLKVDLKWTWSCDAAGWKNVCWCMMIKKGYSSNNANTQYISLYLQAAVYSNSSTYRDILFNAFNI